MPYTVPVSFDQFRTNIELSSDYRDIAAARRDHLVELLQGSFDILEAFPSGSIPKHTAIKGYADLDVIVALHYGKHIKGQSPAEVLQAVRDCLGEYRTNVRKNGQAVTLYYKTWPDVDIVPASQVTDDQGQITYYKIPDMNCGLWISSKPKSHSKAMSDKNASCGPAFKRIVKMIKWWNQQHSSLLQSYHIEVMALHAFNSKLDDYSWDVFQFFDKACDLANTSLWHDGDYVDDYLDSQKRSEAVKRLKTARDKASSAWLATYGDNKDHEEAIRLWGQIFGDKFPAYGS